MYFVQSIFPITELKAMKHWLTIATAAKHRTAVYIFCVQMQNLGPNPTTKAMRKGIFQCQHLGNYW